MNNHNEVKSREFRNQDPLLEVLTVDEGANFLRVGTGRLKSAVKKGEIPGVRRIGRHLRFHRDTLLRWLNG
jgi:excisionase family DNA binding protein